MHASAHLEGSLRHAQLDVAGAPKVAESFVRGMPLWLGHLIHEDIHRMLRKTGVPYMAEVNMTPWLPAGWGGTADAFVWHPDLKAFVLADFKTSKGESMRYLLRDGVKVEHIKQVSAYWHAARKMGLPLAKKAGVYYIPKNDTRSKDDHIEPLLIDFDPVPVRELAKEMKYRHGRVSEYMESLPMVVQNRDVADVMGVDTPDSRDWLTEELEPVQPRVQRAYYDRSTETYELKLVPHWSAGFCPFPDELCNCSTQGTTKIGFYDIDGEYYARPGYEEIEPTVKPSYF